MVTGLLAGAALVPVAQFERREVGRLIQSQRLTVFIGVPFMFAMLVATRWPSTPDFGSLRWCFCSSAPLKPDTARGFRERYGIPVRQLYGTTETGTIALNLDPDPAPTAESVGHPLPGISVEVFGGDRELVPPGATGDIGIRSPAATREYPGLPGASAEAFRGRYFFPGDVGRKDEDGRVYLMGRKSLFINRGGFKVNPYEVEQVLEQHPGVREAAVVGDETEYGDQRVRAVVVTAGPVDEGALVEFCRQRMADFKVPSLIEFRPELPKSTAGKILRKAL
jgi:long-chain acyl-CoA synthetase